MNDDTEKYKIIAAEPPNYVKIRDVNVGDVLGKIAVERRIEEGYPESFPKAGIFKPMHEALKKRKSKKSYIYANHYGEFVGYKIAEKIGIPACKVELARRKYRNKYSGKESIIDGCISYIHKGNQDEVVNGLTILEAYSRDVLNLNTTTSKNNNIDTIISALRYYLKERGNCSDSEIEKVIEELVEVVMFDCTFGNWDRSDENWGIVFRNINFPKKERADTVEMYPMYDNERILGFMERKDVVEQIIQSDEGVKSYSDTLLNSRMGFGKENEKIHYTDMVKYLLNKYPQYSKKALDKIFTFKEKDLDEILKKCSELDECYKQFAKKIYSERTSNILGVLNNYYIEQSFDVEEK